jgi:hypothetical protein
MIEMNLIILIQVHREEDTWKVNLIPDDDHDPTPLELYCDENPAALECRVYED